MRVAVLALALALALALPQPASAHGAGSLLPGDTLARATPIGVPARVFDAVPEGLDVHYFRVRVTDDARVTLRLVAAAGQEPRLAPTVFVFGPGPGGAAVPSDVERPPNMSAVSFVATEAAPGASGALAVRWTVLLARELDLAAGDHVVVVRSESAAPLGLLLDTPIAPWTDPFLLPSLRDDVRAWQGASPWPPLALGALAVGAVGGLAWRWRARSWTLHAIGALVLATLAAGTSGALAVDALRTRAGAGHAALGILAAALALASTRPPRERAASWQRALLAGAAVLAFFACAGATWGPVAGLLGALIPEPNSRPR